MSDAKVNVSIEATSEGVERTFTRVGQKADEMSRSVAQGAAKAGQAVDQIGSGANRNADEFTRAEGRIVSSIKRATAQIESLGKTASQRLELQIDTRNLDRAKFEPYLAKLRELESAQGRIVTSSAGMSSSLDNIGRGLSGVAMAAAAAAGVASLGAVAGRLVSVQREFDVLNASLVTVTGSSANAAKEFAWIKEFAATTPFGLNEVTQAFVRMKALGLDATREALISYGNTASAMGKSLEQMIEAVADASTGEFERLKEFGIRARQEGERVSLTFQGVTKTVGNNAAEITKYLQEIGNVDFAGAMTERAKTLDGAISNLGDSWDELFRTVNQAGVGSVIYESVQLASRGIQGLINNINALRSYWQQTEQQQVDSLVAERSRWQESLSGARPGSFQAVKAKEAIEEINGEIRRLQESFERQQYAATQAADQTAKAMKPAGEAVAGVGREARSAAREADRLAQSGRDLVASLVGQSAGLSADFFKKWEALGKAYKAGAISLQDLTDAQAALLAQQPAMKQAAKDAEDYGKALASTVGALEDRALALETELQNYGLTKSQIERTTIARLEEVRAMASANGATEDYLANLDREIAARKRIAEATAGVEAAEANRKAADDAAKEWQRTADNIEKALVDALMEGGKSGKEYIEGLFRTMVLRPIVQAIVQPVAGSITSAMGFGAPGQGTLGSITGAINGVSNLSSLYGAVTGGMTASLGSLAASAGSMFGSSALSAFGAGMQGSTLAAGLAGPTTAGASGAMGLGSMAGAALPWVAGAFAVASLLGAFDKKPSDKTSAATFDIGAGRVTDIWDMGGKKAASQDQKDANTALSLLVGSFAQQAGLSGQIVTAMGARDGTRLAIDGGFRTPMGSAAGGTWLGDETAYSYGNGPEAIKKMLDDLIDEGTLPAETIARWQAAKTGIDGAARDAVELVDVLALINRGLSDAEIQRADLIQAEGEALSAAADRVKGLTDALSPITADEAWTKATRQLADAFADVGQTMPRTAGEFDSLINSLDLTTDAGREAYQAIFSLAPAFVTLSQAVDQVFASISKTTAESVRDIEMSVLDNAGKYEYLDNEIESLLEKLNASTDPSTIQGLFEQINSKTTQAFNLLDDTEQKRLATQFIDRLYEAESLAQSRLSVTPIDYQPQQDAAKAQQAAAEKQAQAADAQIQAANAITSAAGAIASAANRITSNDNSAVLAGLTSALSALRPAEVGY